jgi:hypothetical protein
MAGSGARLSHCSTRSPYFLGASFEASHLRVSSRLRACATSTASLQGASAISRISLAWKLVIVDNGSTDATPDIIECFKRRLPLEARGTGSGQESR